MLRQLPTPLRFLAAIGIALLWAAVYVSLTAIVVMVLEQLSK